MKVDLRTQTVHQVYTAASMSLVLHPAADVTASDRVALVDELRKLLEAQIAVLPEPARLEITRCADRAAQPGLTPQERESRLVQLLESLKKGLGHTAHIVLTAVKLANVLSA